MESRLKIQEANPLITIGLQEEYPADQLGTPICGSSCYEGIEVPCGLDLFSMGSAGTIRQETIPSNSVPHYYIDGWTQVVWSQGSSGPLNPQDVVDALRFNGPLVAQIQLENSLSISNCTSFCGSNDIYHTVLIVGYRYTAATMTHEYLIKNSWGDSSHGLDRLQWVSWNHCCINANRMYAVLGVHISQSDRLIDNDNDNIPDYIDQCLGFRDLVSTNANIDGDYLGDACDSDVDGDHVLDIDDCDYRNSFVAYDLDGDGVCDKQGSAAFGDYSSDLLIATCGGGSTPGAAGPAIPCYRRDCCLSSYGSDEASLCCVDHCSDLAAQQVPGFNISSCATQCGCSFIGISGGYPQYDCQPNLGDNCTPERQGNPASAHCEVVLKCLNQRTAEGDPDCLHNGNLTKGGVQTYYSYPPATAVSGCEAMWANPLQVDSEDPPDEVGDVCDSDPIVAELTLDVEIQGDYWDYRGIYGYNYCYSDTYDIDFRAWGGTPGTPVTRTGTSVGACKCPIEPWNHACNFYCPVDTENAAADPSNPNNIAWDPIMASQCNQANYPALDANDNTQTICNDRAFNFLSGNQAANEHYFEWAWKDHVDRDTGHPIDLTYDSAYPSLVKIRVDWPDGPGDPADIDKRFLADNEAKRMVSGCLVHHEFHHVDGPNLWFIPYPGPYRDLFEEFGQPVPMAIGFLRDSVTKVDQLIRFDKSLNYLSAVPTVSYSSEVADAPDSSSNKAVGAVLSNSLFGLGDSDGLAAAVLLFEEARVDEVGVIPARLWLGRIGQDQSLWTTAQKALGSAPPSVTMGEIVYVPSSKEVLLVGHTQSDQTLRLWSLSLNPGTWIERGPLDMPVGLKGFRLVHDQLRRRTYIVGGTLASGAAWPLLSVLDPATGQLTRLVVSDTAGLSHRADPGVFLDPLGHRIFIYGGRVNGSLVSTGGWIDTVTLETGQVADGSAGPGPRIRPFVMWDRKNQAFWISGGDPAETSSALKLWRLGSTGEWSERVVLDFDALEPGHSSGTYELDNPAWLVTSMDETIAWPGQVLLASLTTGSPALGLRVRDGSGRIIGEDLRAGSEHRVAFYGYPGQSYSAEIVPGPGFGAEDTAGYTMTIEESTPMEVARYSGWSTNALALHGETAWVTGKRGIEAIDLSDPEAPTLIHRQRLNGVGHAIEACSSQTLCLASTHTSKRLRTIDVSDPTTLAILGDGFGQGQSRGLSVGEGRVYMAANNFGVEVFDVSDPAAPVWVDNLDTGDWVVDVLWSRGVLYIANAAGSVSVFRVPRYASPEPIGTIATTGHPVELRLAGTALLVAELDDGPAWTQCHAGLTCRGGDHAEAFDTRPDTWGANLGQWEGDSVSWVYTHTLRENLLVPTAGGFTVYQVLAP